MTNGAIFDPAEIRRLDEKLKKANEKAPKMVRELLKQSDVKYRCTCCTHKQRVIITLDPSGREQYTCPKTRVTMRYAEMRPLPFTDARGRTQYREAGSYMAGHLILRG